jgi:hypothetical protein
VINRGIAPENYIEGQAMPILQFIYHSFAKSTPLILGVGLFDVVITTLLVPCKDVIDVHGPFAG